MSSTGALGCASGGTMGPSDGGALAMMFDAYAAISVHGSFAKALYMHS